MTSVTLGVAVRLGKPTAHGRALALHGRPDGVCESCLGLHSLTYSFRMSLSTECSEISMTEQERVEGCLAEVNAVLAKWGCYLATYEAYIEMGDPADNNLEAWWKGKG